MHPEHCPSRARLLPTHPPAHRFAGIALHQRRSILLQYSVENVQNAPQKWPLELPGQAPAWWVVVVGGAYMMSWKDEPGRGHRQRACLIGVLCHFHNPLDHGARCLAAAIQHRPSVHVQHLVTGAQEFQHQPLGHGQHLATGVQASSHVHWHWPNALRKRHRSSMATIGTGTSAP